MTYEQIISRFDIKKRYQNRVQCMCPAHADKKPSLSITHDQNKTLVHCQAGCETADVLAAVGLKMADLFDDDKNQTQATDEAWRLYVESREKRKVEGRYDYVGPDGSYTFTRLRLSGKKFIYGIMQGDRFKYGLGGKSRESMPSIFCRDLKKFKDAVRNGTQVFYAEGEKDTLTLESFGFHALTCGGSGDWHKDCASLFAGADVVILQDNDRAGKISAKRIKSDLVAVAKSVRIIVPMPNVEHGDVSDYFKNHSADEFQQMIERAEEEPEKPEELDLDQFHLIDTEGRITGVFDFRILEYLKRAENIFVMGGVPYIYCNGVYAADVSGAKLKTLIRDLIYPRFIKSNTIRRIYDLFISDVELQKEPKQLDQYPENWINFQNGFYNAVTKKMIPHSPAYLATIQIPHEFKPDEVQDNPVMREWLSFITEGDPDNLEMLLQYMGYCLTRDIRQQKFLILTGVGGTGKSLLIRLLGEMVGASNTSNISLSELGQRFAAYGLLGKLLNSCADLETTALEDTAVLKKILGEDVIRTEAKGKDAISFQSVAKLIFSTNELPIVKTEKTNGFYRRLLILPMNRTPQEKRTDFYEDLKAGLPYLMKISVEALSRMYETKTITESESSKKAVQEMRNDSDTVAAFLQAKITQVPDSTQHRIKKADMFRAYDVFCRDLERQPLTKSNFYKSMRLKGIGEVRDSRGYDCFRGVIYGKTDSENSVDSSVNADDALIDCNNPFT